MISQINGIDFSSNGYTCHVLVNGAIRIDKYTDPYKHIRLIDGVTLIIPDHIGNRPVEEIGSDAFAKKQSIKFVILPQTTTVIESQAFANCPRLENVIIPK